MVQRPIARLDCVVVRMHTTPTVLILLSCLHPVSDTSCGKPMRQKNHVIELLKSDPPFALISAVLEAIPPLTATVNTGFNFTLFTGDMVAHDPDYQQSR